MIISQAKKQENMTQNEDKKKKSLNWNIPKTDSR